MIESSSGCRLEPAAPAAAVVSRGLSGTAPKPDTDFLIGYTDGAGGSSLFAGRVVLLPPPSPPALRARGAGGKGDLLQISPTPPTPLARKAGGEGGGSGAGRQRWTKSLLQS